MIQVQELQTIQEWESAFADSQNQPLLVFKHSMTCPISAEAFSEWNTFTQECTGNLKCVVVMVQKARAICDAIEKDTGVQHESPQVLLIDNKTCVQHASHQSITTSFLEKITQSFS